MTLSVTVQNPTDGKSTASTVELPAEVFDAKTNVSLIHQVVTAQLAAARQGTHKTKTRGEVRGGGKKPYRQKGTGRARQGSNRAPQFAGGGVVHGPVPRDYSQRTPKKMKAAALRGALSDRARNDRVHVVSAFVAGEVPSTREAAEALGKVSSSKNVLVVAERTDELTWKSLRNLTSVHILEPGQLNTYDVLVSDDVVFTTGALDAFLGGPATGKTAKGAASSDEVDDVAELAAASIEASDDVENLEKVSTEKAPAKKAPAKKAAAKKAQPAAEAEDADATAQAESVEPADTTGADTTEEEA
ncbi:MAG TPA: 50S ribosomal protein L4 [Jatrophihabitans sp.]|nr:50S ribosomal protein L4 [Jatrophihabitans sp.]